MALGRLLALIGISLILGACTWLPGGREVPAPRLYVLDPVPPPFERNSSAGDSRCANLVVARPTAAPGYATAQMLYRRTRYELESFAYNEWAETPARMLEPLIRQALEIGGRFRAVLSPGTRADSAFMLETGSVRLLQVFEAGEPPYAELSLQARLYSRDRLIGQQRFYARENAAEATPEAGVAAANAATAELLAKLAAWVERRAAEAGEGCR